MKLFYGVFFVDESKSRLLCETCGFPLRILQVKCHRKTCGKQKAVDLYANPLAYLNAEDTQLVVALLVNNGNLSATANGLERTTLWVKNRVAAVCAQLEARSREVELLQEIK